MSATALTTASAQSPNRRRYDRLPLRPMYTPVVVRTNDGERFDYEGHVYDISEGGVQFELDRPIPAGSEVTLKITLPIDRAIDHCEDEMGRTAFAYGNVVWTDDSEPGPARMAVEFTRFARFGDRERLLKRISHAISRPAA